MKIRKIAIGEEVQVGDVIRIENWNRTSHPRVERVTKCFAFVRRSDTCLEKYNRVARAFPSPCGKKDIWSQVLYSWWRPVEEVKSEGETA